MNEELIRISEELPAWLWNILLILCSVLLGIAIKIVLIPLVRKEAIAQSSYSLFRSFIRRFNRLLSILTSLLVFNSLLPVTRFNALSLQITDGKLWFDIDDSNVLITFLRDPSISNHEKI